jgi:peptide/nickel transport system substrate-binding protein
MGIVPKATYGEGYARSPVGAGPFQMVEWREGEQLIVEPNPHWHGPAIAFPRVTFVFREEAAGIAIEPAGKSWDEIETLMHSNAVLFGWGAHDPSEIYALYHGSYGGVDWYNTGFCQNAAVDANLDAAQAAASFEASLPLWRAAQWDGTTGFGARGDAAWAWLVNIDHSYWVSECLDLGAMQVHPHGHGFPITHALQSWTWTCQ